MKGSAGPVSQFSHQREPIQALMPRPPTIWFLYFAFIQAKHEVASELGLYSSYGNGSSFLPNMCL